MSCLIINSALPVDIRAIHAGNVEQPFAAAIDIPLHGRDAEPQDFETHERTTADHLSALQAASELL